MYKETVLKTIPMLTTEEKAEIFRALFRSLKRDGWQISISSLLENMISIRKEI